MPTQIKRETDESDLSEKAKAAKGVSSKPPTGVKYRVVLNIYWDEATKEIVIQVEE